jgi:hypothetical protein
MINNARKKCGSYAKEFIIGDMCDLQFTESPFEVTLEIAGTCGLLSNEHEFRKFLQSAIRHTFRGGLILLTVFFTENYHENLPICVSEWGPVNITPNGKAWICYEVVGTEPSRSIDYVRRTVHTNGIEGCQQPLVDEYEIYLWKPERFFGVLSDFSKLDFVTAFCNEDPTGITICNDKCFSGEMTVVLKIK